MAKRAANNGVEQGVDTDLVPKAFAKAVCDGDFVNFRFLFAPFSPARPSSPEHFGMAKYHYLLPDDALRNDNVFKDALDAVESPETWQHIEGELLANRPAQMPSELLLQLADNAVCTAKYEYAAQTYELLRIRKRMKAGFLDEGDKALDADDVTKAVKAYIIATGLSYDYAAFPEPLPQVPDFQTRALVLHADFPRRPEECIGNFETDHFLNVALSYLLYDGQAAGRLTDRPTQQRVAFLQELVRQRDPEWEEFAARYNKALAMRDALAAQLRKSAEAGDASRLLQEIEAQQSDDPAAIQAHLLDREIPGGEWWQYIKELAYEHPASVLFVARRVVGDQELLLPEVRRTSPVVSALALQQSDMIDVTA